MGAVALTIAEGAILVEASHWNGVEDGEKGKVEIAVSVG